MKRGIALLCAVLLLASGVQAVEVSAPSAVLMEKETGTVLFAKDEHKPLEPASVTKVMTLLLTMEAVDSGQLSYDTMITASAHACSMGGSQIWLKENEQLSVGDMLKAVCVVSANDCAVAMAEHIAGTEDAFVQKMNEKARLLGMADTHFTDCTGLFDDPNHYSCAYDVAVMARELISHEKIKEYSTIWMDTARDGEFALSNTNKLIYYYDGSTGLKTGYTSKAGHCLAATAMRDGVEYVATVLGADSSDHRFDSAKTLLNYAFANYTLCRLRPDDALPPVPVKLGKSDCVQPVYPDVSEAVIEKNRAANLRYDLQLVEQVDAPVLTGDPLGTLTVYSGDEPIAELTVTASETVQRLGTFGIFARMLNILSCIEL